VARSVTLPCAVASPDFVRRSAGCTRSPLAPDLPSLADHPDLKGVNMRAKLSEVHLVNAMESTPSELGAFLSREIETYSAIVKAANIKAE